MVGRMNIDKLKDDWKRDYEESRVGYDAWFKSDVGAMYLGQRDGAQKLVETALKATDRFRNLTPKVLERDKENGKILRVMRQATLPPLAQDRLMGIVGGDPKPVKALIRSMENKGTLPSESADWDAILETVCGAVGSLLDLELLPWLAPDADLGDDDLRSAIEVASAVLADRIAMAEAEPKVRNAHQARQRIVVEHFLTRPDLRYTKVKMKGGRITDMEPGTYGFSLSVKRGVGEQPPELQAADEANPEDLPEDEASEDEASEGEAPEEEVPNQDGAATAPDRLEGGGKASTSRIVSVDVVIQPHKPRADRIPVLLELKSAGDSLNAAKRVKEEITRFDRLKKGLENVPGSTTPVYVLLLGGYFDVPQLDDLKGAGLDWVWEHRVEDLLELGLKP